MFSKDEEDCIDCGRPAGEEPSAQRPPSPQHALPTHQRVQEGHCRTPRTALPWENTGTNCREKNRSQDCKIGYFIVKIDVFAHDFGSLLWFQRLNIGHLCRILAFFLIEKFHLMNWDDVSSLFLCFFSFSLRREEISTDYFYRPYGVRTSAR